MPVCPQCDNRPFSNREALLQHMKSSSAWHPFCASCDRRFSSQMAFDAHMADKHPPTFDCTICNRSYHALFALEDHYRGSAAHPNCVRCGRGFKDALACEEHQNNEHGDNFASHSTDSVVSSVSSNLVTTPPAIPSDDDPSNKESNELESLDSAEKMVLDCTSASDISPTSSQGSVQELIPQIEQGDTSPIDLQVDFRVSSPLTQVTPPFSPMSPSLLPRPGTDIEQYWTSRQNISASRRVLPLTNGVTTRIENPLSPGPGTWFGNRLPPRQSLLPPVALQPTINSPSLLPSPPISAQRPDFTSRLYPGSVRQHLRMQNEALGRQRTPGSDTRQWDFHSRDLNPSHTLTKYRGLGKPDESRWTLPPRREDVPPVVTTGDRPSIFYETLTPRAGTIASEGSPQSSDDILRQSPGSNKNETDTRPTSASSTPCTSPVKYKITPSSDCPSPRSPDVVSPIGLGVLPSISPLPTTPIDLIDLDIPEARKPLPDSPISSRTSSPPHTNNSISHEVASVLAASNTDPLATNSPLSTSSTKSFATSPQEPLNVARHSPPAQTPPITPVALAVARTTSTSTNTSVTSKSNPNPLHCRVCLADSCDDITASMCGHIFCNRCITNAVIKTNRCPVCQTPTLLYCLFRLDIAA